MTTEEYVKLLMLLLQAHQAYLEVELEKATVDFIYPRQRERNELFTTYIAHMELLCREFDNQLKPAPPMDERIKAIILLRNVQLEKDQCMQLALKRAGQQSFQEVADLLRTLDRPEAFLRATAPGPPVKSFPILADQAHTDIYAQQSEAPVDLQSAIREVMDSVLVPAQPTTAEASGELLLDLESNSDFDAEGQLRLDFESDAEYDEPETLQIMAFHSGRAQVRRDLNQNRTDRGFRPPPKPHVQSRPHQPNKSAAELLTRTRCLGCQKLVRRDRVMQARLP